MGEGGRDEEVASYKKKIEDYCAKIDTLFNLFVTKMAAKWLKLISYLLMRSMAHELRIGLRFSVLVSHLCMQIYACIH